MSDRPLKICLATSELAPLAKTGGLADVSAALSEFLDANGHDVRVLLPLYSSMDTQDLAITPVDFLQDKVLSIGPHRVRYSIDTTVLPGKQLRIYLLRCPELYQRPGIYTEGGDEHLRFIALSCAAIEMCQHMGFAPDVFHCHDWHTSLIPLYLKTRYAWDRLFRNTRSVLTIHNIGYQGIFNARIVPDTGLEDFREKLHQDDLALGRVNFLKTGVLYADLLTTVSPTYAREILEPEYGMGLQDLLRQRTDSLVGILNGVDYAEWNPEDDPLIPHAYSSRRPAGKKKNKLALMKELELDATDDVPLIGMVTRLTYQKGIELVQKVVPALMQKRRFALAVLGSGEPRYEQFFSWLQQRHRDRVCFYRGFNNKLAHWIEAGSDLFLMPSRFEPCGLNQMYSLRYGTVPIVRRTGGLADSVQLFEPSTGKGTGIVFDDYNEIALSWGLNTGLDLYRDKKAWRKLVRNGMAMDYSWERQGQVYVDLFRRLISN
ncbi:MAG: glycogen synthase GlgA [Xanthomonadales bacterium]|nr:glycogen synthase GlgA [Xanthomonadales bacterium]